MSDPALSKSEKELWLAWERAADGVLATVHTDVRAASGVSGSDYAVLSRLMDAKNGEMRHRDLVASLNWEKSRLSIHLRRMVQRGLVSRRELGPSAVIVVVTTLGARALRNARAAHAAAVRAHLASKVSPKERALFVSVLDRLTSK